MGHYRTLKSWLLCATAGTLMYSALFYAGTEKAREEIRILGEDLESKTRYISEQEKIYEELGLMDKLHPAIQGIMFIVRGEQKKE